MSTSITGINIAFPPKRKNPVDYYRAVFESAASQGVNCCRIWLCDFSFNYYLYNGEESSYRIPELKKIVLLAKKYQIKLLVVLFDFNEFTNTNIFWDDYEHTFNTSFISKFIKKPTDFFRPKDFGLGLSKYQQIKKIIPDDILYGWELFNEIDHVGAISRSTVIEWAGRFSDAIRKDSSHPIYISFANPLKIKEYVHDLDKLNVRSGIHTYNWPYKEPWKNVVYWQAKYPELWIMECGGESISTLEKLECLIAGYLLNSDDNLPMLWFWDNVLACEAMKLFVEIRDAILPYSQTDKFRFKGEFSALASPTYAKLLESIRISGWQSTLAKSLFLAKKLLGGHSKESVQGAEFSFSNNKYTISIVDQRSRARLKLTEKTISIEGSFLVVSRKQ